MSTERRGGPKKRKKGWGAPLAALLASTPRTALARDLMPTPSLAQLGDKIGQGSFFLRRDTTGMGLLDHWSRQPRPRRPSQRVRGAVLRGLSSPLPIPLVAHRLRGHARLWLEASVLSSRTAHWQRTSRSQATEQVQKALPAAH